MKVEADKRELRMRRGEYGPPQWSLASPAPGAVAKFRRWNAVLIPILVFLVLGAFVAAEAPRSNTSSAALKESARPALMHNTKSIKGSLPDVRGHGGSGFLNQDVKNSHHAG